MKVKKDPKIKVNICWHIVDKEKNAQHFQKKKRTQQKNGLKKKAAL
jgi:hypothetical protein